MLNPISDCKKCDKKLVKKTKQKTFKNLKRKKLLSNPELSRKLSSKEHEARVALNRFDIPIYCFKQILCDKIFTKTRMENHIYVLSMY